MSSEAIEALEFRFEDRLSPDDVSDDLRDNPFIVQTKRSKIICPEPGCAEACSVVEMGGEKKFLCHGNNHTNPYDESLEFNWKIETMEAIESLLSELGFDTPVEQNGSLVNFDLNDNSYLVVPGDFSEDLLQPIGSELRDHRNLCVIIFQDDTKREVKPLVDRAGGVTMVVSPPGLDRKIESFESMVEIRNEMESEYEPTSESVDDDLIRRIHDNPQYIVGELIDFEKIEGDSELRSKMESLCTLAFSQILDCPLHPMGMENTGSRVPDGFGFIYDQENSEQPILILDSKSVSSDSRDYPTIAEKQGPQYRKYLEIIDDICYKRQWDEKILIFISPEFNRGKIEDFLDELTRSKFDDYHVVFMSLKALNTLMLHRTALTAEREVRLQRGGWPSTLNSLFSNPDYERSESDYELERENGTCITATAVKEHFANNITDQESREGILEIVEDEMKEFDPE